MNYQGPMFNPFENITTNTTTQNTQTFNQTQTQTAEGMYQQYQAPMMNSGCCGNQNMNLGCCNTGYATQQCCNQVVNRCCYEDIPNYVNYNTHYVNNIIRRHYDIPTYSQSQEYVYYDETVATPNAYLQNPYGFNNFPFGY